MVTYFVFIDYVKAPDKGDTQKLWKTLVRRGLSSQLVEETACLYAGSIVKVKVNE